MILYNNALSVIPMLIILHYDDDYDDKRWESTFIRYAFTRCTSCQPDRHYSNTARLYTKCTHKKIRNNKQNDNDCSILVPPTFRTKLYWMMENGVITNRQIIRFCFPDTVIDFHGTGCLDFDWKIINWSTVAIGYKTILRNNKTKLQNYIIYRWGTFIVKQNG